MTSALAAVLIIIPAFFFYSPSVEKNRVVTIQKTLVITQERKTPAYYLYQHVQNNEALQVETPIVTTYLSTQSYLPSDSKVAVSEMQVSRREISSDVDAGFQTANLKVENIPTISNVVLNENLSIPAAKPTNQLQSPGKKWATIRGKFELKDGVGIVDHYIEIKRVEEGFVREIGRIDLKAGSYSIDIESPQGFLEAKITDRTGVTIGNAQQRIVNLQGRGGYFEGPTILVGRPAQFAVNPHIPSSPTTVAAGGIVRTNAPSFRTSLFSDQHTQEKPTDAFTNISKHSSTLARLVDANLIYKTLVTIRQSGDENETPVFTKKWIQGVIEYISDQQKIEFKSETAPILMGRVFESEKSLAGIQVQIENHPGILPVYFDQFMIPNFKQTETSESGYFMFLGLEESNYNVAAFKEGRMIGYQMFATENDAISYQNIVTSKVARSGVVRVFDAFTSEPVDADLIIPDVEDIVETTAGTASYRTLNKLGIAQFLARVNKLEYVPMSYFQDSRKDYAHIPMVREGWLKQLQTSKLINDVANTGMILGFVPELSYEVFLAHEDYSKDNIVYFDQAGNAASAPTSGGGFLLFNVPLGTNEIIVQEKNSEKIYSQVFEVKINQVSASHFSE